MHFDEQKVRDNVRRADTGDLLDRVTAYRAGMEPTAIEMIEQELRGRGVSSAAVARHREIGEAEWLWLDDGSAAMCSYCRRPAVQIAWGWFRIFGGMVPLLPRRVYRCADHSK